MDTDIIRHGTIVAIRDGHIIYDRIQRSHCNGWRCFSIAPIVSISTYTASYICIQGCIVSDADILICCNITQIERWRIDDIYISNSRTAICTCHRNHIITSSDINHTLRCFSRTPEIRKWCITSNGIHFDSRIRSIGTT